MLQCISTTGEVVDTRMKMAEFTPSKEICYYFKNIIIVIIIFETTQFLIIEEKAHVCDIFCMNYTRLSYVIKDKFIILLQCSEI